MVEGWGGVQGLRGFRAYGFEAFWRGFRTSG